MNKVLIYDADCPLCRVYTKGLVAAGTLPAEARQPSTFLTNKALADQLDPMRRRHEIPLLDLETGEAQYGVDAILTILGGSWPRFARFVRQTVLIGLARRFYAFISYNRRIIFPVPAERWHLMDLTPDFNAAYRIVFLILLYAVIAVGHLAAARHSDPLTMSMLMAQAALALVVIARHSSHNRLANLLDYSGHLGMSLLVGGLIKATGVALDLPLLLLIGNAVMVWQHIVRLRVMQLPDYLNIPFVIFVLLNC
jgi:predicted DCC family thiol-disulfide oxidoreductase YuxK